jgi:mono/diheme cytochrome c family protein/uncharacterized cupredoxin-like copper-binding protein
MPRQRPTPPPFEPEALDRSLDRYLTVGLVFMMLLVAGFITYKIREPDLRRDATAQQQSSYQQIGRQLFATNCASCHGKGGNGGSAPVLNSKEFLKGATDGQIERIVGGGISGTEMPAWALDFGGTLTDEQIQQLTTYLRSLEGHAPSVPTWRSGTSGSAAAATTTTTPTPSGTTVQVQLSDATGLNGPMTIVASPTSVPAGNVTFVVKNNGTIDHEMIVLKTDTPFDQVPVTDAGDPPAKVTTSADKVDEGTSVGETGDPNLKPGETRTFTIKDMKAGNYVLVCNIAKHYQMGMREAFKVS